MSCIIAVNTCDNIFATGKQESSA